MSPRRLAVAAGTIVVGLTLWLVYGAVHLSTDAHTTAASARATGPLTPTPDETVGHAPLESSIFEGPERNSRFREATEFPIDPLGALTGTVVDEDDRPIPGAEVAVRLDPERGRGSYPRSAPLAKLTTDEAGRFTWPDLLRREAYALEATHPAKKPTRLRNISRSELHTLNCRIVLKSGPRILGLVLDDSGAPVQGARVEIFDLENPAGTVIAHLRQVVETDAAGRFQSMPLERGEKRISASAEGRSTAIVDRWTFAAAEDQQAPALVVGSGHRIEGVVLDVDRGSPIANAVVRARIAGLSSSAALSAGDGKADAMPPTTTSVGAFRGATPRIDPFQAIVEAGPDGRMNFRPAWPKEIASRAHVDLEVQADAAGRWAFDGLIDAEYLVWVEGPGAHSELEWKVTPGSGPVVLKARTHARLAGFVRHEDGRPATNFAIAVSKNAQGDLVPATERRQVKDPEGRFDVPTGPGALHLHVWAEGAAPTSLGPIALQWGEQREGVVVALMKGAAVTGRLLSASGEPIAGAEVHLWTGEPARPGASIPSMEAALRRLARKQQGLVALTDAVGAYRIECVPAGPWTLRARAAGFAENDQTGVLVPPTGEVQAQDIALAPESGVEIAVDTKGIATAVMVIHVDRPDLSREVPLDADGRLRLGELAAGRYQLIALPQDESLRDPGAILPALASTPAFALRAAEWRAQAPLTLVTPHRPIAPPSNGDAKPK